MAENGPDPGGGPGDPSEDWKFVTNNSKIVILPDPRLASLLSQCEDDQSSTGTSDHVQGEGLEDLEYEYEPGISLHHMEFSRHTHHHQSDLLNTTSASNEPSTTSSTSILLTSSNHQSRCIHCGVDYESGKHEEVTVRILLVLLLSSQFGGQNFRIRSGLLNFVQSWRGVLLENILGYEFRILQAAH